MGAAKERTDIASFLSMGAEMIENEWHKGEVLVERHGMMHPQFIFTHQGKKFAEMNWRRTRTGIYLANNMRLTLNVSSMGKIITAKDESSSICKLIVKSPLNPHKAKLIIQLTDNDGFTVMQKCLNPINQEYLLQVTKEHYVTSLIDFKYWLGARPLRPRSKVVACINVASIMRWEAKHFHQLMALVMARIAYKTEKRLLVPQKPNLNSINTALLSRR